MHENTQMFAFILMPFDKAFDDVYKLGIKETASKLGILAERVDEQIFSEGILERIYRQIEAADFIVADMSGQNPNVFYEVGYAHAKGKLCILMTRDASDIPFDLKHHRHIVYGSSIDKMRKSLENELTWAKGQITKLRSSGIKVDLATSGFLETTNYSAKAMVDFTIDLHNISSSSMELDAIYFYCGKGWRLSQDQKECASTASDIPDLETCHFITPPIRRLSPKGWAKIKFSGEKILAWATEGAELKASYRLSGRAVIRLMTAAGPYDYELNPDVVVEELPF